MMRFSVGRCAAALLFTLLLPLAAAQAQGAPAADAKARKGETQGRGFLWEARKGDVRLLLAGSIHVGRPAFAPPRAEILQAVRNATSVVFEVDVFDAQRVGPIVQRLAYFPEGEPGLDERLDPALRQRIEALLARANLDLGRVARMKPWTLANTLVILDAGRAGLSPAYSSEALLNTAAREAGKTVRELETIELQLGLFDSAPAEMQMAYLEQAVRGIESGDTERELRRIVTAWERRDAGDMEKLVATMRAATGPAERFVIERIIEGRHPRMLERIDELAASGKPHLVVVGALHYFGPNGLLEALKARGYRVRAL
jgi:uncharacterized protein YbaP (TraB family)